MKILRWTLLLNQRSICADVDVAIIDFFCSFGIPYSIHLPPCVFVCAMCNVYPFKMRAPFLVLQSLKLPWLVVPNSKHDSTWILSKIHVNALKQSERQSKEYREYENCTYTHAYDNVGQKRLANDNSAQNCWFTWYNEKLLLVWGFAMNNNNQGNVDQKAFASFSAVSFRLLLLLSPFFALLVVSYFFSRRWFAIRRKISISAMYSFFYGISFASCLQYMAKAQRIAGSGTPKCRSHFVLRSH